MSDFETRIKGIQWHGPEKTTVRCLECELKARGLLSWHALSKQITPDGNHGVLDSFPVEVLIEISRERNEYKHLERFYRLVCESCQHPLIPTAYRYTYILNGHTENYKSANRSALVSAYMQAVEQTDFQWAIVFDEVTGEVIQWREMVTNTLVDTGMAREVR